MRDWYSTSSEAKEKNAVEKIVVLKDFGGNLSFYTLRFEYHSDESFYDFYFPPICLSAMVLGLLDFGVKCERSIISTFRGDDQAGKYCAKPKRNQNNNIWIWSNDPLEGILSFSIVPVSLALAAQSARDRGLSLCYSVRWGQAIVVVVVVLFLYASVYVATVFISQNNDIMILKMRLSFCRRCWVSKIVLLELSKIGVKKATTIFVFLDW